MSQLSQTTVWGNRGNSPPSVMFIPARLLVLHQRIPDLPVKGSLRHKRMTNWTRRTPSWIDRGRKSPCCIVSISSNSTLALSSRTCLEPSVYQLDFESLALHGWGCVCCMVTMSPRGGQFHIFGFLHPPRCSQGSQIRVILLLLLSRKSMLSVWSRSGYNSAVWNFQSTAGTSQLYFARASCTVCVIAFLIAHHDDSCARLEIFSASSLTCPGCGNLRTICAVLW